MNKKTLGIAIVGIAVLALTPYVKAVDVAALESAFAKVRTIADGTCAASTRCRSSCGCSAFPVVRMAEDVDAF